MNVQIVIFEFLASERNDHLQSRCVMHRAMSSAEGVYREAKHGIAVGVLDLGDDFLNLNQAPALPHVVNCQAITSET